VTQLTPAQKTCPWIGYLDPKTRVGAAEKAQLEKLGLRVIDASRQGDRPAR
jgi:hypothetical protein